MTAIALKRPPLSNGMLWSGRILMVVWGAFWIWFNVASGIGEIAEHGVMALLMHLIMPALILGVGYVAWRWRLIGGIALLALTAGFAAFFGFGVASILLAPPALAGLLLIGSEVVTTSNDRRKV